MRQNDLKQALDAAIAKETAAQAAARTAVDKAKNSKSPADIRAAEALLAHVQDTDKKSAMQDELNAVKQEITDARTALSKLIDKAKNTPTDGLAAETVAALNTAIAAAKAVNNDQKSTVAQLQAMMAALLLAVLVVLLAPVLVSGLLRAWSASLAALGGSWLLARRFALLPDRKSVV